MLSSIKLRNFRNYTNKTFQFSPGVTVIIGPNGVGKTNLLEAVLMLTRGSSWRVNDAGCIAYTKPWLRADGVFETHKRSVKIIRTEARADKSFEIDGTAHKRLSFDNSLPVVLFEPEHLRLLTGSPARRRAYCDDLLVQTDASYKRTLGRYRRALLQRNSLLKQSVPPDQLFIWNIKLSELGGVIAQARRALIEAFNATLGTSYSHIAGKKSRIEARYETSISGDYTSSMMAHLERSSRREQALGFTSHGPHRDDISFMLNGKNASLTASRGETRTLLLALKTIELQLIEKTRGQRPLLLLDDVFSELDENRSTLLTQYFQTNQVIITSAEKAKINDYSGKQAVKIINLSAKKLTTTTKTKV